MNNNLVIGSIIIFPKDYEDDSPDGHVAIISSVLSTGITIAEQNYNDNIFPRFISYNDLKNVNYEALFSINLKATQELNQRVKTLEKLLSSLILE